jgi:adenylate cyclase
VVQLRRQDCVLHSDGEISLGAPFSDFSAPTVSYKLMDGSMALARSSAASAR